MTAEDLPPSLAGLRPVLEQAIERELAALSDADRPPTRRNSRRPLLASASIAAVATVATVVVLLLSATTGAGPAYAITANRGGTYTVQVFDLTDAIPELNAKFASLGIDETVIPVTSDCPNTGFFGLPSASESHTITVGPGRQYLAPGFDGYLAAIPNSDGTFALAIGAMRPPLPPCFSTDSPRLDPNPISSSGGTPTFTTTTP